MSDWKVIYKGIEVPAEIVTLDEVENDKDQALYWFKRGVDLAQGEKPEALEPKPEAAYRYFHDGDKPGDRWYRRVPRGAGRSTREKFRDYCKDRGWTDEGYTESLDELEDSWVEVTEDHMREIGAPVE